VATAFGGTTYYASTNGSSANSGLSPTSPWDLHYALQNVGPSNTIIVMPGTWSGQDLEIDQCYTTFKSQVKWGARLLAMPYSLCFGSTSVHDVTIDGFEIAYNPQSGIKLSSSNCVVKNCWIHHCGTNVSWGIAGILATSDIGYPPNNMTIEDNLIEYIGTPGKTSTHQGIYVNGTNVTIRGNVCRYNIAGGIQISDNGTVGSTNVNVYNNLSYNNGSWAFVVASEKASVFVNAVNNTFVGTNAAIYTLVYDGQVCCLNCTNNILLGGQFTVQPHWPGTYNVVGDYNLMSKVDNLPLGAHCILTNYPGFVNANSGLYWITANSPARNAAFSSVCAGTDFFGNAQSAVADVGAFQYNVLYASDKRMLDPSPASPDYWLVLTRPAPPTTVRGAPGSSP
jgi:hypothetical protein